MSKSRPLTIFLLAMINVAAICGIKNWPITAQYGFSSLFFYLFAALGFFIPASLVSAELASSWPKNGGIYAWVKEALGHKMGFLAIWFQWIANVVWYPTILSFVATAVAYTFNPSLVSSSLFTYFAILLLYWGATLINFKGMKVSGWISTIGVIGGTMIPGLLIIGLGLYWYFSGRPLQIEMNWHTFLPNLSDMNHLAFLAGTVLGFAGIEMSAVHVRDVVNPQKNYPKAILLSVVIILGLSILGTLAIAVVIPQKNINLLSASLDSLNFFLKCVHLEFLTPLFTFLVGFGALGSVVAWIIGPSRGLLTAAQDGDLPPILHKMNKQHMPVAMLVLQGLIVTALATVFLLMPSVSSSFWILLALASILNNIMYLFMFITAIVLRYKQPKTPRPYRIGGGLFGMWIVSGVGFLVSVLTVIVGFFPPSNMEIKHVVYYELFLVLGTVLFSILPLLILLCKKPSWNIDKNKVHEGERS